ncbi:hypothetical protein POJ06DRAFT_258755 [Lipomyces tetrasporus]|uniref:Zn(2)-C6 fungal-type domain-containing protein n=1 Tax=Lipomyces tetrasporus TaxID=54092 RepID=A0AAD7QQW9_9ASCO|nr:uncharacterized protein POJ06DRAFT_258755 [Lipomyces tetrasporus]KAJ8098177.1 hypothetical protein POJ06DRAFT_258755 [Lipomyces tetrasporus]
MEHHLPPYNAVPRIKRSRKITICLSCYKRRVKCDKEKPQCSQCRTLSIRCEYASTSPSSIGGFGSEEAVGGSKKWKVVGELLDSPLAKKRPDAGYLAVDILTGESRYASTAYWPSFFKEESAMADILDGASPNTKSDELNEETLESIQCRKVISAYLPQRQVVEDLVGEYFSVVHPFCPIVDRHYFLLVYDSQFWNILASSSQNIQVAFVVLLFATLYGGALSKKQKLKYDPSGSRLREVKTYEMIMEKLLAASDIFLRIHKFPERPSLCCLMGATVIQFCRRRDGSMDTTFDISHLIRIAQVMGLHRDPALFRNSGLDELQIQVRRRVWWQLVYLDVTGSLGNGLPTTSHPAQNDVKMPSVDFYELEEDKLFASFANCRSNGIRILSRLLSELYGINQPLPTMVAGILRELEEFRRDVKRTKDTMHLFTFNKRSSRASIDVLHKLQTQLSLLLDVICEKLFLIYYFPLASGTPDVNRDQNARAHREQVIHTAIRVMRLFLDYSELPKYVEFCLSLSRYHQFHAMIIILRDIYHYPHDIPEPTTRYGIKDEDAQPYDERTDVLQQGLTRTEYLGMNSISPLAVKQWKTFLQLKEEAWNRKYAPPSQSIEAFPATLASSGASVPRPSFAQTSIGTPNVIEAPEPAIIDSATINQSFASDTSSVEFQNFLNIQFTADKISGRIGTASSNDYVQHVLGINSWDIDWTAYGFRLE